MSSRKTLKLICGLAGSSAVLLFAAAAADSHGYFGEQRGEAASRWSRFTVLRAAKPAWTPANHTPAPTGHAWDFNWDKYVAVYALPLTDYLNVARRVHPPPFPPFPFVWMERLFKSLSNIYQFNSRLSVAVKFRLILVKEHIGLNLIYC